MAIEHGRTAPTVAILARIAKGLGVRSTDLLGSPKPSLVEKFYTTLGRQPKLVPIAKRLLSARPS
jgi:transcriptional regulator with XRE-family HTH domain